MTDPLKIDYDTTDIVEQNKQNLDYFIQKQVELLNKRRLLAQQYGDIYVENDPECDYLDLIQTLSDLKIYRNGQTPHNKRHTVHDIPYYIDIIKQMITKLEMWTDNYDNRFENRIAYDKHLLNYLREADLYETKARLAKHRI